MRYAPATELPNENYRLITFGYTHYKNVSFAPVPQSLADACNYNDTTAKLFLL